MMPSVNTTTTKVCSNCGGSPVVARGCCSPCYARLRRNGSTGYQNRRAGVAKQEVYEAVVAWFKRKGFAPSMKDIRAEVESTTGKSIADSTIKSAVRQLVDEGRLRRDGERRSLTLPEGRIVVSE